MRLTLYTDYAIRALTMLARQPGERMTIATVAAELQVSHNHLVKVVNELVAAGWVFSVRGKNGGISLAVNPRTLSLAQVVGRTEKHAGAAMCLDGNDGDLCSAEKGCSLKYALNIAQNRFMGALAEISIEQLLESPAHWHERLKSDDAAVGVPTGGGNGALLHFR